LANFDNFLAHNITKVLVLATAP